MWEDACSSCDTVPEKHQYREGSVYLDSHGEKVILIGAWVGGVSAVRKQCDESLHAAGLSFSSNDAHSGSMHLNLPNL